MDDYIIVNDKKYPARISFTRDNGIYLLEILVELSYKEVKEVFVSNAKLIIDYGEDTKDVSDYKILYSVTDILNNKFIIRYKRLSDVEKLIELHYGNVNSIKNFKSSRNMKDEFKDMYIHKLISIGAVHQAVEDGLLTPEDYKEITGEDY